MATKNNPIGFTAYGRTDIENEMNDIVNSVINTPKIPTMDKKLIVEAATPGHYPRLLWEKFGIKNMPPWSLDELSTEMIECVKAGAAGVHSHPRDPDGPYCYECNIRKDSLPELEADLLDRVYKEVDFIPLNHAWHPTNWEDLADADFITPAKELLKIGGGNKYMQGGIVITWIYPKSRKGLLSTWFTADTLRKGISFLEENGVKPLVSLHMDHLLWFKNNIIDAGVMKTRPHINIQEGKHDIDRSFADPMAHLNLINSIELVKKTIPDCTIGLHVGGRNWLPMTVLGIMLGVDLVRIGIEDTFWMYPHKNDFIRSAVESVEKVVQISKALGRDIATPSEARKTLGIKATSDLRI